jgi:hypothetical protein
MKKNYYKRNKKSKILSISLLLSLILIFNACKPDGDVPAPTPGVQTVITLSHSEISLDLFDDFVIAAESTGSQITWSSSDSSIVSVDNGKIIALAVGKADIIASADGVSNKCEVTVVMGVSVPIIDYNFLDHTVEIIMEDTYLVEPSLSFKSKPYNDVVYSFEAENGQNIFSVNEEGLITAINPGTATLTVRASWRNSTITDTITVIVKSFYGAVLNSYSETIYTREIDGYNNSVVVKATVLNKGQVESGAEITWKAVEENSESIATIVSTENEGEALIIGMGEGTVNFYAECKISDTQTITTQPIKITVQVPIIDVSDEKILDFDKSTRVLDLSSVAVGDITKITNLAGNQLEMTADGSTVTLSETAVSTLTVGENVQNWIVRIDNLDYKIGVIIVTKIIRTAEEFRDLYTYTDISYNYPAEQPTKTTFSGYIILGNNIDGGTMEIDRTTASGIAWGPYTSGLYTGFCGTLDGRGYTIKGFKVASANGLIGYVGRGGTIKNIAFVDTDSTNVNTYNMQLLNTMHYGRIENVYIYSMIGFNTAMLDCKWTEIENFVIYSNYIGRPYANSTAKSVGGVNVTSNIISDSYTFTANVNFTEAQKLFVMLTDMFLYNDYKTNTNFLAIDWSSYNCDAPNSVWTMSETLEIPVFKTSVL